MQILQRSALGRLVEELAPCVVDLGARGGPDEDMLPIAWATHVIGFEPEPDEAARLAQAGDTRWKAFTVLPFAVGGTSGPAVLYLPRSSQGASLLPHNPGLVNLFGYDNLHLDQQQVPVQTVTLDGLAQDGKLPRVDYLKIDIEGAELDVLKAGQRVLADCVALKVECSFLQQRIGQPLVWEVVSWLIGKGFRAVDIHDIYRWRRRNLPGHPYHIRFPMPYSRGQLAQCDMILLRSPDSLAGREHALRLLVAAATLGYYDYAIDVLRAQPSLGDHVEKTYGFGLERALGRWSSSVGHRATLHAIADSLRGLIPLSRSALGRLSFAKPDRPY